VIGTPGNTGVATLRAPILAESDALQAVWESSSAYDDPGGFSRGGWSVSAWSTDLRVLVVDGRTVGLAAVRAEAAPDGAMPARIALALDSRRADLAALLVRAVLDLVAAAGGQRARVFVPERATWTVAAARSAGFQPVRTIAHMLLPAETVTPSPPGMAGLTLRAIADGEDEQVLAVLNQNWEGTWNFVSITAAMLAEDLRGQRDGMLLAVDAADRIVGTCHAIFEPEDRNPDGNPRAWISNLTVDPAWRGRGVARTMLVAGIAHLRGRGATSITLGVDADDPAPFRLYQSVGFGIVTRMQAWDRSVRSPSLD
jgi:mycothiol synthase